MIAWRSWQKEAIAKPILRPLDLVTWQQHMPLDLQSSSNWCVQGTNPAWVQNQATWDAVSKTCGYDSDIWIILNYDFIWANNYELCDEWCTFSIWIVPVLLSLCRLSQVTYFYDETNTSSYNFFNVGVAKVQAYDAVSQLCYCDLLCTLVVYFKSQQIQELSKTSIYTNYTLILYSFQLVYCVCCFTLCLFRDVCTRWERKRRVVQRMTWVVATDCAIAPASMTAARHAHQSAVHIFHIFHSFQLLSAASGANGSSYTHTAGEKPVAIASISRSWRRLRNHL